MHFVISAAVTRVLQQTHVGVHLPQDFVLIITHVSEINSCTKKPQLQSFDMLLPGWSVI